MNNLSQKFSRSKSKKPSAKLTAELMEITPMIARQWLDSTDPKIQRRLNHVHVDYLAKEMKSGNWDINGQPIQIDTRGNVINGQHRLNACIESGKSFNTLVVFDVSPSAIKTIDTGIKVRGIADFLEIEYNAKNSSVSAAAIKFIYRWDRGKRRSAVYESSSGKKKSNQISPAETVEFLKKNPGFFQFVSEALSIYDAGDRLIVKSMFCAMLWIIERENPVCARKFFVKLSMGTGLGKNSPIGYLRKRLIEEQKHQYTVGLGGRLHRRKAPQGQVIALIVKAFNYYVEGVEVKSSMRIPKEVPEIIGAAKVDGE